jgi:hypothetical protein
MDKSFKKAVCDAFHGESDEDILASGFTGDLEEVNLHAQELAELFADTDYGLLEVYDFVYAWSINDEVKFPWET